MYCKGKEPPKIDWEKLAEAPEGEFDIEKEASSICDQLCIAPYIVGNQSTLDVMCKRCPLDRIVSEFKSVKAKDIPEGKP